MHGPLLSIETRSQCLLYCAGATQEKKQTPQKLYRGNWAAVNYASSERDLALAMDYEENWADLRTAEGSIC